MTSLTSFCSVNWTLFPVRAANVAQHPREVHSLRSVTARPPVRLRNLTPGAGCRVRGHSAGVASQVTVMSASPSPSPAPSEQLPPSTALQDTQWSFFAGDLPREWHGLWVRYGPDASLVRESRASRAFRLSDNNREIEQKNVYDNVEFMGTAELVRSYRRETLPPKFVFEKDGSLFINFVSPTNPVFGFEMACVHPADRSVRFSIVVIFRAGRLDFVSLVREVDVLRSPKGHFWKFSQEASIAVEVPAVEVRTGRFQGTERCITPDCGVLVKTIDETLWSLEEFLGIDDSVSGLQFPDGIQFWFPTSVMDAATKEVSLSILWQVDDTTTVASKVVYKNEVFVARYTAELFH